MDGDAAAAEQRCCALSGRPIEYAVRGRDCAHPSCCFDLVSYLQLYVKGHGQQSPSPFYKRCPICGAACAPKDLCYVPRRRRVVMDI